MNRNELLNKINILIDEISSKCIDKESHDYYLRNHLINLSDVLEQKNNANELLRTAKTFMFFCTDSMNWDTTDYKSVVEIGMRASKIAKSERNLLS
jgi:hypothetical protein